MKHSHLLGALASALALNFASDASAQHISYINPAATTGLDNGSDWTNGYITLERGLDPAINSDIPNFGDVELRIKEGTYIPNAGLTYPPASTVAREAAFVIPSGVIKVIGGYKTAQGTDPEPVGGPTILSGDIGIAGSAADNCYHVVVFDEYIFVDCELVNVIVQDGNADFYPAPPTQLSSASTNSFGAGILVDGVHAILTDVRVRDCFAYLGGGIGVRTSLNVGSGSLLRGRRPTIRDNLAGAIGAGIYLANGCDGVIGNSTIRGNSSTGNAGGIFTEQIVLDFEVNNTRIFDNVARGFGGGALISSRQSGTQGAARFINCTIAYNSVALGTGAGLYFAAGPALLNTRLVQNTILFNNPAATNDDNIVALGPFVVDISNSFLGARNSNPAGTLAATATGNFIDASGTTLLPGWHNGAARIFKLTYASVCIDQGADGLLTDDRLDIDDDLWLLEDLPREYFMFDEALISNTASTREVSVYGAGTVPPGGNIGVDNTSGTVIGPICDIGAHEYRNPAPAQPQ